MAAHDVDLARERAEPVPEAAVDRRLRRPQVRDRLAALVDVVELRAHERAQDPAAPVRREDADDGHPRRRDASARDGQLERERAGAADDATVLVRGVRTLRLEDAGEPLDALLARVELAEEVEDRRDRLPDVVLRRAGADLDAHGAEGYVSRATSRR
jgi:hypothetical protein